MKNNIPGIFQSSGHTGVVASSKIVGGIFFATDELLGVEECAVRARPDFIDYRRLQVQKHRTRHMLACTGLTEEGVECIIPTSQCLITLHLPVWLLVQPMIFMQQERSSSGSQSSSSSSSSSYPLYHFFFFCPSCKLIKAHESWQSWASGLDIVPLLISKQEIWQLRRRRISKQLSNMTKRSKLYQREFVLDLDLNCRFFWTWIPCSRQ